MRVGVKEDKQEAVAEMGVSIDEPEIAVVFEMVSDPKKLSELGFSDMVVQRAADLKVANDGEGQFPVIRTEEGWSHSGRLWDAEQLVSIAEQCNELEPVGHLGHIPDADISTSMPDPQTTWIGAFTRVEPSELAERKGDKVTVIYTAGSNLPTAKVRELLRNKAVKGTSWWGLADLLPVPGKGVRIKNFKLKGIDWARKGSEGMPTSRVVAMAREMTEGDAVKDKELSAVTPDEFKQENPNGYALLVAEMTKEKDEEIAELTTKVDEGTADKSKLLSLCEALGITDPEQLLAKVKELTTKVGENANATLTKALDKLLGEKIEDEEARGIIRRLLPVGEMETAVAGCSSDEDAQKIVSEMVDAAFNADNTIQLLVSEQSAPIIRQREEIGRLTPGSEKALESVGATRERVTI